MSFCFLKKNGGGVSMSSKCVHLYGQKKHDLRRWYLNMKSAHYRFNLSGTEPNNFMSISSEKLSLNFFLVSIYFQLRD